MSSEETQQIGARIAAARRAAKLSQKELARRLGVTIRTIQNYESGSSTPHRHVRELAAATHVSQAWILDGAGGATLLTERSAASRRRAHEQLEVLAHNMGVMQSHIDRLEEGRKRHS